MSTGKREVKQERIPGKGLCTHIHKGGKAHFRGIMKSPFTVECLSQGGVFNSVEQTVQVYNKTFRRSGQINLLKPDLVRQEMKNKNGLTNSFCVRKNKTEQNLKFGH